MQKEERPAGVVAKPKQAGETQAREKWAWVEPSVWTERMLAALSNGVKGSKWFSLMDKVYSGKNLKAAWEKVKANQGAAGVDRQSIEAFEANRDKYLAETQKSLREEQYRAEAVKRVWILEAGQQREEAALGYPQSKTG